MQNSGDNPDESSNLLMKQRPSKLSFGESISLLSGCKKDLFTLISMLTLADFSFVILLTVFPLFLTEQFDFSDFQAGFCLGIFGLMVGVASTYTGILPNKIGPKPALFLSSLLVAIGMFFLAFGNKILLIVIPIYTIIAAGTSLLDPIILTITKHYVPGEARLATNTLFSLAFIFSYLIGSIIISIFWSIFENDEWAYGGIFIFSGALGVIGSILAYSLGKPRYKDTHENKLAVEITYTEAMRHPHFVKYLWFMLCLTINNGFSGIFVIALPIYMTREFGDDADWGTILFLLSLVSLGSLIVLSPFIFDISNYSLIATGCLLQGVSMALLIIPPSYFIFSLAAVIYGLGNIYLPRLFDYVLEIAPEGHEGIYLCLSNIPSKGSLFLKGLLSGLFLESFLSDDEESQEWLMWLIIFGFSICTASCFFVFRSKMECVPKSDYDGASNVPDKNK